MPDISQIRRKPLKYPDLVNIPEDFKKFLWDEHKQAPKEKLVYRVLLYGDFEAIRKIFRLYPEVCFFVATDYPDIHRGVRYWIKKWWYD